MREIRVGQRYRKIDAPWAQWQVIEAGPKQGSIRHFRIAEVRELTNVRLISEKALGNPRLYELLEKA